MDTYSVGDVLEDAFLVDFAHLFRQGFYLFHFGFALFGSEGGVGHGLEELVQLAVYFVYLRSDFLICIVVRCSGCRVIIPGQLDVDVAVFEEEVHQEILFAFGCPNHVAVHSCVLRAFEGECSVGDDSRIQFHHIPFFSLLQVHGLAVGTSFYSSGHYITFVSATGSHHGSHSEQVGKFFHCFCCFIKNDILCEDSANRE